MNELRSYVERAFVKIPDAQKKTELMQDITEQLEEHVRVLIEQGKSEEDAINKAIVDFGDINEIVEELKGQIEPVPPVQNSNAKSHLWFSVVGSAAIILLLLFINLMYTKQVIWFVYPAFAVLWWPLSLAFFGKWRKK